MTQIQKVVGIKRQTTRKKVKVIGTETYINEETGEVKEMQVISIEERDFNFHKIFLKNFIASLEIVGNQKTKLAYWIIDNLKPGNILPMTYRQISENSGVSLFTVNITMGILLEADFLRRINMGCYMVNPDIIFKGEHCNRINILNQYHGVDKTELSDDEKLQNLYDSIEKLTRQAEILKAKIQDKKKNFVKQEFRKI